MKIGYIVLGGFFIYMVWSSISAQNNTNSFKTTRLECHEKSTVFEDVLKKPLLQQLQSQIASKKENIKVTIEIRKSKYMPSKLFEYINVDDIKKEFENLLDNKDGNKDGKVSVKLLIDENDKYDPNKKNPKSKLFAGFIEFHFSYENQPTYMVQIDFFDQQGADISQVLRCGLESVNTIKK